MSSSIWTAAALSSEATPLSGLCWRVVEAQHVISTAKLTDNAAEQKRLEDLIEQTKPNIPPECTHLNFLLATPFRYGAPYPKGSRFRRAGLTPGVYYASDAAETAAIEMAFYRVLFHAESPATPFPANAGHYTAFSAEYAVERHINLANSPFDKDRSKWTHPIDYGFCQELAETARSQAILAIKYESARDPSRRINVALLSCRTFTRNDVVARRSWRIHLNVSGARLFCEAPQMTLDLPRDTFAGDPRIAAMNWLC
jgi:hypothetical protein